MQSLELLAVVLTAQHSTARQKHSTVSHKVCCMTQFTEEPKTAQELGGYTNLGVFKVVVFSTCDLWVVLCKSCLHKAFSSVTSFWSATCAVCRAVGAKSSNSPSYPQLISKLIIVPLFGTESVPLGS